jgi:hypothetical protein
MPVQNLVGTQKNGKIFLLIFGYHLYNLVRLADVRAWRLAE